MSKQPRDDGNDPIPVLGIKQGGGHRVPFDAQLTLLLKFQHLCV